MSRSRNAKRQRARKAMKADKSRDEERKLKNRRKRGLRK